jgi:anti-sigma factor RsiW
MTSRIANFGSSAHHTAQELLPWFVMGTLDEHDRSMVEAHLRTCLICQRELEWQEQLRAAHDDSVPPFDVDRALAKLRIRIANSAPEPAPRSAPWQITWRRPWTQWALAAQFVVIIALGAVAVSSRKDAPVYRALGQSSAAQAAARLVVVFAPQATEVEIRGILRRSGTRIVDGPTSTDAYVLAAVPEDAQHALDVLRTEGSVQLAQSLTTGEVH